MDEKERHTLVRSIIYYEYLQATSPQEIHRKINQFLGAESVSLRTVYLRLQLHREGTVQIFDKHRSGREPIEGLSDQILNLMNEDPYLSVHAMAQILMHDDKTIKLCLINELDMKKVNFKYVPYQLNSFQKAERVRIARLMLKKLENKDSKALSNIVTLDETWIYFQNYRSSMWVDAKAERPQRPKLTIGSKKCMITVAWNYKGVISITFLPKGEHFSRAFFFDTVIQDIVNVFSEKRPTMGVKGITIHMDNARPHLITEKLENIGMKRMPHPPYSPDIAPSDFFLFGIMKRSIEGKEFKTEEEIVEWVRHFLVTFPKYHFQEAYHEWTRRLHWVIDHKGEYVP